jgi:hypothetical protein
MANWLKAMQLFLKLNIGQYCSAINKRRAEPGNEAGKINMAADSGNVSF